MYVQSVLFLYPYSFLYRKKAFFPDFFRRHGRLRILPYPYTGRPVKPLKFPLPVFPSTLGSSDAQNAF